MQYNINSKWLKLHDFIIIRPPQNLKSTAKSQQRNDNKILKSILRNLRQNFWNQSMSFYKNGRGSIYNYISIY